MELVDRVRALLPGAEEKRMFGGTGFMVEGALACSVSRRGLLVRVAREEQESLVGRDGVEPMVMGGRASRGWVHVSPAALGDDTVLAEWVHRGATSAGAAG
jgi:TfoX/Sxy family transcriptional regulator of competence genes